jgi:hypothetical protein
MARNFHDGYAGSDVTLPSERSTGFVFAAMAAIIAIIWRNSTVVLWFALGLAVLFAVISMAAPAVLKPINVAWFQLGMLLHRIVSPVLLFAIFALVFVPGGVIMRIWRDPLRSQRAGSASSYWVQYKKDEAGSMSNQF